MKEVLQNQLFYNRIINPKYRIVEIYVINVRFFSLPIKDRFKDLLPHDEIIDFLQADQPIFVEVYETLDSASCK